MCHHSTLHNCNYNMSSLYCLKCGLLQLEESEDGWSSSKPDPHITYYNIDLESYQYINHLRYKFLLAQKAYGVGLSHSLRICLKSLHEGWFNNVTVSPRLPTTDSAIVQNVDDGKWVALTTRTQSCVCSSLPLAEFGCFTTLVYLQWLPGSVVTWFPFATFIANFQWANSMEKPLVDKLYWLIVFVFVWDDGYINSINK